MWMKTAWLGTKNHVLDNEKSKEYKSAIKANRATHEWVPSWEHRRKIDKKDIQKYRNHFVGVLAGLLKYFPMHLWCRLLPQAEIKLNLQHKSAITTKILSYSHVHGLHHFIHKPLAPLGCPVLAHKNLEKIGSWADDTINAWNLGTSMEHHRDLNVYSKHTRYERIVDALFFKHKHLISPIVKPEDTVV